MALKKRQLGGMARRLVGLGALGVAAALCGCGAGQAGTQPIAVFPSRAELSAIAARPAAKLALPETAGLVDAWTIERTPPDAADAAWTPEGPWEGMFADVAAEMKRRPRLTRAMACAAREMGRFYLEHKALPASSLRRFMIGACGGLAVEAGVSYQVGTAAAASTDAEIFNDLGAGLRAELKTRLGSGADTAGFWLGRRDDQLIAIAVAADTTAQLRPFSRVPDAQGQVTIEGQLNTPVQHFEAYINHGRAGVKPCEVDLAVARPKFRFICTAAPDDRTAWIQMLQAPPGRVLATAFAQALVRQTAEEVPAYEAKPYAEPQIVHTQAEFTRAAVDQLNRARGDAGLPAVTLATRASATATQLAPHYFAALLGAAPATEADLIALGLLAGWEVSGVIRNASLMSAIVPTLDAGRWLTLALEMPIGRTTLFAPDIQQVAFGPLVSGDPVGLGAVVTGYRFHHGSDHTDDVKELLTRVVLARRRMGLPEPKRLGTMADVLKEELAAVHLGTALPVEAMDRVLARAVDTFGMGMQAVAIEASSLDELAIPEEVLRQPTLHLDIGVTHRKPPGAAWAQYTIVVVFAAFEGGKT